MSNAENQITVVGNLTRDPELRYTQGGTAVCNFSVAQTPRRKTDNGWEDGDTSFFDCSVWKEYGEHVAQSFQKGNRVMVVGVMKQRFWEDKEGNKRNSWDIQVDECGHSLKWGSAQFDRTERKSSGQQAPAAPQQFDDEEAF